jgi:hypothetical protein
MTFVNQISRSPLGSQSRRAAAVLGMAVGSLTLASAAHAATLFMVDPNPSDKIALNLDKASGATTDSGTVVTNDDIEITVNTASDFASGNATIKPSGSIKLTDLVFTPVSPTAFDAFSFRGQDLAANQLIDVIVTDQANQTESFSFTVAKANQDFDRIGIISDLAGETIKSIEIQNSGGFKQAKQFAFEPFTPVTGGVPEPATWASMLLGFGVLGGVLRRSRKLAAA